MDVRAIIVAFVVLPLSFVVKTFHELRRRWFAPTRADHGDRVARVQAHVREAHRKKGSGLLLCTDRNSAQSHSVRLTNKKKWAKIAMGDLRSILGLSKDKQTGQATLRCEPGVTVGEATRYLLKKGLILETCLEMEDATLGGLVSALGMTTHSHVCGLIHETIVQLDIVLADGTLVHASQENHSALFNSFFFSHGTVGLLVGLEIRCVQSKEFVRVKYTPFNSTEAFVEAMQARQSSPKDAPFFIEGFVFSKSSAVLVEGEMVTTIDAEAPLNDAGVWWKPWFFKHAERALDSGSFEETIPIYAYLMRHDRSMCMTLKYIIPFGNHLWFRVAFGWLLPPYMAMLKGSHTRETRRASVTEQVYQDVAVPWESYQETLRVADRLFGVYPLLCYPLFLRHDDKRIIQPQSATSRFYLNLGIYGIVAKDKQTRVLANVRELEAHVRRVGGFQHSYCDSLQSREEFREMFHLQAYDTVRRESGAEGSFVPLFEKRRPEEWILRLAHDNDHVSTKRN
eukprot:g3712.t1